MEEDSLALGVHKPYYMLKIYVDRSCGVDLDILGKYRKNIMEIHGKVDNYKVSPSGFKSAYVDAGFDLFTPRTINVGSRSYSNKVDQGIVCAMTFAGDPVAFYLYPRSSTGSKTPLRLSNSVGIIDSGYRGHIIACFDNGSDHEYNITKGDRLVQICGPNIMYPIYPVLVGSIEELGVTSRGSGGFGSTGR